VPKTASETEGARLITGVAPSSLEDVYREQYTRMVRVAHPLTGSNAAAEDLVQAVFVALKGRWDQVHEPVVYLRAAG
jgi:DNA-directed RNA polymerase specialized sigma24 family protein